MHRRASHEPQQGKRVDDPDTVHITAHQVQSQPSHQVPVWCDNTFVLVQLLIQGSARNPMAHSLRCNRQGVPHNAFDSLTLCKHRASRPAAKFKHEPKRLRREYKLLLRPVWPKICRTPTQRFPATLTSSTQCAIRGPRQKHPHRNTDSEMGPGSGEDGHCKTSPVDLDGPKFGRKYAERRPNDFRPQVPNVQSAALDRNTSTKTQTVKWGRGVRPALQDEPCRFRWVLHGPNFGRKSAEHRPNDFRPHCLQTPNVQSAALDKNTPTETQARK